MSSQFTDGTHEQFLAHIMKTVSLVDKQPHYFDQLKKANTAIVTPDRNILKKKELDRLIHLTTKNGKTPPNKKRSRVTAMAKQVSNPEFNGAVDKTREACI